MLHASRSCKGYHLCCFEALSDIQVGGRLVDHVHVSLLRGYNSNSKALQLSSRQVLHITVQHL
jgi:hypothetical protein